MSTISEKVNDAIAALTAVNYVLNKEQSYQKVQVLAARAKALCQQIKAQARTNEVRKCQHEPKGTGYSIWETHRCAKCGKANVFKEEQS